MQSLLFRSAATILGAALLAAHLPARADLVDDWLAAKTAPGAPTTFAGPPFEAKFGHPAPPTSLLPPVWQKAFARMAKLSNGKLIIKEQGAGTLLGARDGFKAVRGGVADRATRGGMAAGVA